MIQEFLRVKDLLIEYFSTTHTASNVPTTLSEFIRQNIDLHILEQMFSQENILDALKVTVPKLWSLISESINLLFGFFTVFLILLYIVFILLDYESISEGWAHLMPKKYRKTVTGILNDVKDGMNRYFRGQALVALCVGILFSIGFLIIDFPLAIGLGLFIGALNMVPYLQIIGFVPTIMLAILKAADTGDNFWINHSFGCRCIHSGTNHTRWLSRSSHHGKDYRFEPSHHPALSIYLGIVNGNVGYDYSFAADHSNALLLSTIHH